MFASWFIHNQKKKNQEKHKDKRQQFAFGYHHRAYVTFEVYCFFFLDAGEAGRKEWDGKREKVEQETNRQL